MRCLPLALLSICVTLVTGEPARAQNEEPRLPSSLREGLLARFDEASSKIVQLAQAFPAEKYRWRPAAGVRSVGEVLVHVGMANYYTLDGAGVTPSVKLTEDEEKPSRPSPRSSSFSGGQTRK